MTTPTRARIGVKNLGLSIDMIEKPLLSMPVSVRIQPVMVVPTLEPRMMARVSLKSMMLELTRPTSMTMTPEEDWMATVMTAPKRKLSSLLLVTFLRVSSSEPPAIFSREDDMTFMPYRKNARPAMI